MNEEIKVNKLIGDTANITDLVAGSGVFTGPVRFSNGFYGEPKDGTNINQVESSASIQDSWTILCSDGTRLRRITFSNLCAAIEAKLNG